MQEATPAIHDWEAMCTVLLENAPPTQEQLDDELESRLINIVMCAIGVELLSIQCNRCRFAVRQVATGEVPPGRQVAQRGTTSKRNKDEKQLARKREQITTSFIKYLPKVNCHRCLNVKEA